MKIRKNMKVGVSIIFLLLLFTSCLSLINLSKNNNLLEENSLSLSAPIEDPMEDNDNHANAWGVTPNYYPNLTIIETDEDWFKLYLNPGDTIDVYIYFNNTEGDLDLELYDPFDAVTSQTGSYSTADEEHITFTVGLSGMSGDWRIRVYHYDGSTNVTYDLDIWINIDDWMENNDDFWSAWGVGPVNYPGLKIVDFDEDWFQIYLNPGDMIDVGIYFNHFEGDLQLVLYDPSYIQRKDSLSMGDDEFITYMVDMPGDWRIRVYHKHGNSTVHYNLDIWLTTGTGGDDWAEENDDFWSAWGIGPGFHSGLMVVGFDDDWFQTYLNPDDIIEVKILFDDFKGDLQLELYDPSYIQRADSLSMGPEEFIRFTADMSGEWRIRVYHQHGDSDVPYELDIRLDAKVDDFYELNNNPLSAYDLIPYEGWWLTGINGPGFQFDEDWFEIYAEPGFEHLIIKSPDFGREIQLEVYDSNLNNIGEAMIKNKDGSSSQDYNGPMRYDLPSSGTYYIKVYGNNRGNFYDFQYLTVCLLEEQTWLSDIYGMGVQSNLDFYFIDVTPGFKHLVVELLFNHTYGNIDMTLYDAWGSQISNSSSFSDNEYINTILQDPGMYFLLIQGHNMGNEYDLWWDDNKTDTRPDDFYEPNNNPLSAYDLSNNEYQSLWEINDLALQYNEDWYKIEIDEIQLQLIVIVIYDSAEGLMGFEIYDSNFTKITGNFTLDDNDYIDYEVPSNGTYYIRVFGDNSGNVYNLWWAAEEPESIGMIPGYDTLILIVSIVGVTVVLIKIKRSKFRHQ